MCLVVFDIETYGSDEVLSYKDFKYLKETGKYEEEEEVIESLSLNPFLSHIISVGYVKEFDLEELQIGVFYLTEKESAPYTEKITYMGEEYEVIFSPIVFKEVRKDSLLEGEKRIIKKFLEILENASLIISFNGKNFDIPFLKIRCMVNNIDIHEKLEDESLHIDILNFFFRDVGYKHRYYSFDFISRQFGLKTPKEKFDGKDVKHLFEQERYEAIAKYNAYDVIVLYKLFKRIERYIKKQGATEGQLKKLMATLKEISKNLSYIDGNKLLKFGLERVKVSNTIDVLEKLKEFLKTL